MGTRSRIGVMHGDNCKSVYCHWDGYLDHNGRILLEHYDSVKANQLVALGDISSLAPSIDKPEGHSFDTAVKGYTVFYGRDRKEEHVSFDVDPSFEAFFERADGCGAEYYYIMKDGVWYCGTTYSSDTKLGGKLVPLAEALADQDIDNAETLDAAAITD